MNNTLEFHPTQATKYVDERVDFSYAGSPIAGEGLDSKKWKPSDLLEPSNLLSSINNDLKNEELSTENIESNRIKFSKLVNKLADRAIKRREEGKDIQECKTIDNNYRHTEGNTDLIKICSQDIEFMREYFLDYLNKHFDELEQKLRH